MDPHNNLSEFENSVITNWGTVISNVVEQLPSVESDSEVSTTNEESDGEQGIFQRNQVNLNGIKSAGSFSNCNEKKKENEETSHSRLLLFQRLKCQAPSRTYVDIDEEFPIYEAPVSKLDDAVPISNDEINCANNSAVNDTTPTLSLQTLDTYNLDDVLSNFSTCVGNFQNCHDKENITQSTLEPEVLMNQLVNLSLDQSSEKRKNQEHLDSMHNLPLKNDEYVMKQKQMTTNLLVSELRCSEPTTIFLDLRSKAPLTQKFQNKSKNVNKKNTTVSTGTSTSSIDTNSHSTFSRSNTANMMTEQEIESDDSEDDFEQWKAMRTRFKSTSFVSTKKCSTKTALIEDKPAVEDLVYKHSHNVQSSATNLNCLKNFCGNLNDLNSEDTKQQLREITLKMIKDRKKLCDTSAVNGNSQSQENPNNNLTLENEKTDESSMKTIVNGLNCNTETPNGLYASQRLKKPCSCSGNEIQSETTATPHGKSTVLFAEEPQTDSSDTTYIFRNKQLVLPENKTPPATTMCVQTEESFSTRYNAEDKKKYATEILNISRKDLTTAAENVAEQKKFENEVKIPRQAISSGSRHNIVQNQRKQPPLNGSSTLTIKSAAMVPAVPFENRTKFCALLENIHQENKDHIEKNMFPFLYDREATFSNEIDTIPNTVNSQCTQKMVLLTFHMVSPGCIVYNRSTSGHRLNPVDQPNNLSLTYSLLISWLLALIPDKLEKPHDPPREDVFTLDCDTDHESDSDLPNGHDDLIPSIIEVPFNVVSLHQAWQEETQTIVTNAIIIPNFFYKPDISGRRKKPKKENAFFQVVWHFLQSNRVQDVCPWYSRPESPIYTLNEISLACSTKPLSTYMTISNDPKLLHKALNKKPGFFWKVATPEDQSVMSGSTEINQLETTICLLQKDSFSYPLCLMDLVVRLQLSCLDVVGLRLSFVTKRFVQKNILSHGGKNLDEIVPCAAVVIRGKSAIKKVQNIIGPRDPVLARMTDHGSLNAVYGEQLSKRRGDSQVPTEMNVFNCPRGVDRVKQQLVVWFGGRISPDDNLLSNCLDPAKALGLKSSKMKSSSKLKGRGKNISTSKFNSKSLALSSLSANAYLATWKPSNICLLISSRFPPQFLGDIIAIATDQGFFIEGIKRLHLNERKVAGLCVPSRYAVYFNPQSTMEESLTGEYYEMDNWWQRPVTIILLGRENASIHQSGLIACIQSELIYRLVSSTEQGHLHSVTNQCFHICPYNDTINHIIGPICKFPEIELSSGVTPRSFFSNPEMEQVVVLALLGNSMINECGCILQTLLHGEFYLQSDDDSATDPLGDDMENEICSEFRGFELLGIKLIPMVSSLHAKELTPFEVGTDLWCDSIPMIKDSSALLCVLRRINAFNIIRAVLKIPLLHQMDRNSSYIKNMDRIMSSTPEISYRQIKTFFSDKELFADNRCRPLLKYLPPPMRVAQYLNGYLSRSDGEEETGDHGLISHSPSNKSSKKRKKKKQKPLQNQITHTEESILDTMLRWPHPIASVLIIKPDAFPRHVVKILRRLYQENFYVVAVHMTILSEDQASQIMPTKYEKMLGERSVFISHMTSAASLVVCVQRINAVKRLIDVAGPADPREAPKLTIGGGGNWRAEFGIDEFSNAIHVSERYVAACEEQKLFFPEGLCCKQTFELKMEQVPSVKEYSVMREDKVKGRDVRVCDDQNVDLLGATGMEIQPVCLVLSYPVISCPQSIKKSNSKMYPPYIDILEQLLTQGFEICAWHMACFSVNQAQKLYELMGDKTSDNLQFTVNLLTSGPSFVLFMQRENGLILFDSILGSCLRRYSLLEHSPNILRTQTLKQTHSCTKHLFHRLENKRSIIRISHKRALEWQDKIGVTKS